MYNDIIYNSYSTWLAKLPYGLDSNVTKLQANPLTNKSVSFIIFQIVLCNLVSIKDIIMLLLLFAMRMACCMFIQWVS